MTELNQQNVRFGLQRLRPKPFIDECFRAPSALGEIDYVYCILEIVLDILSPAAAGMFRGIFTDRRVANDY